MELAMPQAKRKTTTRPAPAGQEPRHPNNPEFGIVCDLEEPVRDIESFARLLGLLRLSDDDETAAVLAAADRIIELVETVEEGRGKLFDLLHPGRADFEAAGGVEKWREKLRPDETS
jgi:hypothetical protein